MLHCATWATETDLSNIYIMQIQVLQDLAQLTTAEVFPPIWTVSCYITAAPGSVISTTSQLGCCCRVDRLCSTEPRLSGAPEGGIVIWSKSSSLWYDSDTCMIIDGKVLSLSFHSENVTQRPWVRFWGPKNVAASCTHLGPAQVMEVIIIDV